MAYTYTYTPSSALMGNLTQQFTPQSQVFGNTYIPYEEYISTAAEQLPSIYEQDYQRQLQRRQEELALKTYNAQQSQNRYARNMELGNLGIRGAGAIGYKNIGNGLSRVGSAIGETFNNISNPSNIDWGSTTDLRYGYQPVAETINVPENYYNTSANTSVLNQSALGTGMAGFGGGRALSNFADANGANSEWRTTMGGVGGAITGAIKGGLNPISMGIGAISGLAGTGFKSKNAKRIADYAGYGATAGSMIGGPVGGAIGAGIGGLVGATKKWFKW